MCGAEHPDPEGHVDLRPPDPPSDPRPLVARPPDVAVDAVERCLAAMRRSMTRRHLQRRIAPRLSAGEVTIVGVLDVLDGAASDGAGGLGVGAVGEELGIDQPRASRLVARAVEAGYARRIADPVDGRRQEIRLTDTGAELMARIRRDRRDAVAEALDGFDPEDVATFARVLAGFTDRWRRSRTG